MIRLDLEKALRKSGLTAAEVSRRTELKEGFLSALRRNNVGASLDTLIKILTATGVEPNDLFTTAEGPSGMSEPGAVPWQAPAANRRTLARTLAPECGDPFFYQVGEALPFLQLGAADVVLIDLRATVRPGDLAALNIQNTEHGQGRTCVRRWLDPWATTGDPADDMIRDGANDITVRPIGPVLVTIRGVPGLEDH